MKYSNSQRIQLQAKYREAFGSLPEGVHRWAASTRQTDQMYRGMEESIATSKKPNWEEYVNLSGAPSR